MEMVSEKIDTKSNFNVLCATVNCCLKSTRCTVVNKQFWSTDYGDKLGDSLTQVPFMPRSTGVTVASARIPV